MVWQGPHWQVGNLPHLFVELIAGETAGLEIRAGLHAGECEVAPARLLLRAANLGNPGRHLSTTYNLDQTIPDDSGTAC